MGRSVVSGRRGVSTVMVLFQGIVDMGCIGECPLRISAVLGRGSLRSPAPDVGQSYILDYPELSAMTVLPLAEATWGAFLLIFAGHGQRLDLHNINV